MLSTLLQSFVHLKCIIIKIQYLITSPPHYTYLMTVPYFLAPGSPIPMQSVWNRQCISENVRTFYCGDIENWSRWRLLLLSHKLVHFIHKLVHEWFKYYIIIPINLYDFGASKFCRLLVSVAKGNHECRLLLECLY